MNLVQQNTTYTKEFGMVSSTDHNTAVTGITPVVNLSKAGGAFAAAAGVVTEISAGWYKIALTAVDTNTLRDLAFHITGTGADSNDFTMQVVAFDPFNVANLGLTNIPGVVQPQTGDAFARIGAPVGASISADIAGVPTLVWDMLTSVARVAGSYGAKLKAWVLGSDNKSLLSTDAGNVASLSTQDEAVLNKLNTMINSTPAFTAPALALAPSGGGGSAPTTGQIAAAILANPANLLVTDGTGRVNLNLAQAVPPTGNTAQTVGDALNAARAQGFGKWVQSGTTLTIFAADGTTAVRVFTLDSATAPTQRA